MTLEARILAVCDVYNALVSNRVYRDVFSHEGAARSRSCGQRPALDRGCVLTLASLVAEERAPVSVAV